MNNYEILAPAGSIEQLQAAVKNGCDSVYLGLDSFNARMKAPNFTKDNLREWVDFCHVFGVKVYVTVNTSIKNGELADAADNVWAAYKSNADGVIVTDLSLLKFAAALPKPFDVVASTQLNCHDEYGALFLKKMGASTVVCARECSLDDIAAMSVGVKIECFLHGALCVCQSGQCLFSSMVGGNSGNRGLCAQPCRKLYKANSGAKGYLLSARDLNGLGIAKKLSNAGAKVFKIEGRNRRPEYAAATSRVFSDFFAHQFEPTADAQDVLCEVFNRGNTSDISYLYGGNDNIVYPQQQNNVGLHIGYIKNGKIVSDKNIEKGDCFKIFDGNREVGGATATSSGTTVSASFSAQVKNGMTVNRTTNVMLNKQLLSARRMLAVTLFFDGFIGQNPIVKARHNDVEAVVVGDFVLSQSISQPTTEQEIAAQLQKSGDSCCTVTDVVVNKDNIFIAKSQLNALRRDVLSKLQSNMLEAYNSRFEARISAEKPELNALLARNKCENPLDNDTKVNVQDADVQASSIIATPNIYSEPCVAATCFNERQLAQAEKLGCKYLIYKPEHIDNAALSVAHRHGAFVDIPSFANSKYLSELFAETSVGIVCHNVGHVELARTLHLPYIAGRGLNIFNDAMAQIFDDAVTFVYSVELTLAEIKSLTHKNGLIFVDGELPLMQLVHCPYKVAFGCSCASCKANTPLTCTDEQGNAFKIRRRKTNRCTFELINGKKLSVAARIKSSGRYLVDFQPEVIKHYVALNGGSIDDYACYEPYTKGRLYDKIN